MDQLQTGASLIRLMRIAGTDTQDCEVKAAAKGLPKSMPETLSAFANGSGGVIVLGVSEEAGFKPAEGFSLPQAQDAVAAICSDRLTPPLRPGMRIELLDGSPILIVEVSELPPREKPCYVTAKGMYEGAFVRSGDGDRKLSHYEIDRLLEERTQPRHDLQAVEGAEMADLDAMQLAALLGRERSLHPNVFGRLSDEDAMLSLRVAIKDAGGKLTPTLAGLLALGIYPQKHFPRLGVTVTAYPGTTKEAQPQTGIRYLDSVEVVGAVPTMIVDTVDAVRKNSRTAARVSGALREDIPEYPLEAVREAVANALMHRDYSPQSWGTQVQVNLFADRLEVLNPGGLYGAVTVDALGTLGISFSRNEFLSKLLGSTPYPQNAGTARYVVENKGTGYIEILAQLAKAGMEQPIPRDKPGYFSLTFRKAGPQALQGAGLSGNSSERMIIQLASAKGIISAGEAEAAMGVSRSTAVKYINQLIEKGVLEPTEPGISKNRRYRLTSGMI